MIIISALDNSGELYAADLIRELRKRMPGQEFVGIGGRRMADAGCLLVHDISGSSAMLTGVIGALRWALPAFRTLVRLMKTQPVDLVILVDSPTFNLPLARAAHKRGLKTFYYIAPQVWAWAEFRVRKIKRRVDRLAVILPFEQDYFRRFAIPADFVGHPFLNHIKDAPANSALAARLAEIQHPKILLMPGSRRHVVREILPAQLRVVRAAAETLGPITVTVAAWSGVLDTIREIAAELRFDFHPANPDSLRPGALNVCTEDRRTLIEQADLVLAASGTGTLEVAWHARPMIIMYNASRLVYHGLARWLIRTKYLSLINILAGRELVPEFMPYIKDENAILHQALAILKDPDRSRRMGDDLQALVRQLYRDNPSQQVADQIDHLLKT